MKATGVIRRIDDLGRISIPKEIRERIFGTKSTEGYPVELFLDGDSIVLKGYISAEQQKEKEIRNKAIDEFAERICEKATGDSLQVMLPDGFRADVVTVDYVAEMAWELAEQMKGGSE